MNINSCNSMSKLKRLLQFLSLLTVEPFIFLFMFVYTIKKVPTDQLVQDKICLFTYHLSANYCKSLPEMTDEEDYLKMKSTILKDTNMFTIYQVLLWVLPSILSSFFIGSWTDKYLNAKKVLLISCALAGICEAVVHILNVYFYEQSQYMILLSTVSYFFSGGLLAAHTGVWSYLSSTTPPHLRALRMCIAEIVSSIAQPLAIYCGGLVLNTPPLFKGGQLYNYSSCYILCGLAFLIAFLWIVFMVDEMKDIKKFNKNFSQTSDTNTNNNNSNEDIVLKTQKQFDENKDKSSLKLLFDLNNFKDMFRTCCKKRENYGRLQVWLLFTSLGCYLLSHIGPGLFLYSFTQKEYSWNSEQYSNAGAIGNVVQAVASIAFVPILLRVFHIKDTTLTVIGLVSYFSQNIIRGTVLNVTGFYISLGAGCLGSAASVGVRAHFSKIVEPKELGKVFSLLSCIESAMPLIAAAFFTTVFNATMDTNPGLSFIITALIQIIPFVAIVWIHFYTVLPDFRKNKDNSNNEVPDVVTEM